MRLAHLLAAAFLALVGAPSARADQILPAGRIDAANNILFGAIRLGQRAGGRTTLTPDAVQTQGVQSVGDAVTTLSPTWAPVAPGLIRYNTLLQTQTKRDGESWESSTGIEFAATSGWNAPWAAGKTVALGDNLYASAGLPEPYVYRVVQAGTLGSATPTAGPGSAAFADGTARLQWVNYDNLAAKIGLTNTTVASGNAGKTWANNFNFIMRPLNHAPRFMTNTEFDFQNDSGYHCDLFSGVTCNALSMFAGGQYRSTALFAFGTLGGVGSYAAEWGLSFIGQKLVRDAVIQINAASQFGLSIGRYGNLIGASAFSGAAIRDESTTPRALSLGGTYSDGAINLLDATQVPDAYGQKHAILVAADQTVCLNSKNYCFRFDSASGRIKLKVNTVDVFSIDGNGVVRAKGGFQTDPNP